jgi:hypothetical protein
VINANPKEKNPPCPIQLPGMGRAGTMAKAAPREQPRDLEHGWTGRNRNIWFGLQVNWPPPSAPVPRHVHQATRDGEGHRNQCLMCLEPGHNYQSCMWYWAWLLSVDDPHQETIDTMPDATRELLRRHLEVMDRGHELDLPVGQTIAMGINIIAQGAENDLGPLDRYGERLERQELAQQLDNPMGWQHMDIGQLRAMVQNRFTNMPTRECRGRYSGGYPKQAPPVAPGATSPGTATSAATGTAAAPGTHSAASMGSADVLQQQQAIFDQQAQQSQEHQAPQEQHSDKSAETWNENQVDYESEY